MFDYVKEGTETKQTHWLFQPYDRLFNIYIYTYIHLVL